MMAQLPTAEQSARKILDIYSAFQQQPGGGLRVNVFVSNAAKYGLDYSEIDAAIEYSINNGWLEASDGRQSYTLTQKGYQEM